MLYLLIIVSLFLHVWADFYKQGWLAQSKCKSWWREQEDCTYTNLDGVKKILPLYKNDYWGILMAHSIHWSFCVMLPSVIYGVLQTSNIEVFGSIVLAMFVTNTVFHSIIDNLKANVTCINLLQDQIIHIMQIILTINFLYFI